MFNRVSLLVVVTALLVVAAEPAAADLIMVDGSVSGSAQILTPADGAIYVVRSPSATVTIEATARSTLSFTASATNDVDALDLSHATGGRIFHEYYFGFDGTVLTDIVATVYVPDGVVEQPGDDDDPDNDYAVTSTPVYSSVSLPMTGHPLSITKDVGVGRHMVLYWHKAWASTTELHIIRSDWIEFEVIYVPIPEPATLTMVGAALLVGGVGLRRRRRTVADR